MKKVINVLLNLSGVILGLIVFGVTAAVIASTMLNSYKSYKLYEEMYYQNDLDIRSLSPAEPQKIDFEDDFVTYNDDGSINNNKSSYKYQNTAWAEDLDVKSSGSELLVTGDSKLDTYVPTLTKGGSINLYLVVEEKTFMDLDFVISSEHIKETDDGTIYGVEDLLSNVSFVINGETMEEEVNLVNSGNGVEWHHLVMTGFAIPAGHISISIKSNSGKNDLMPQVRNVSIFTSVEATFDSISEPA